MIAPHDHDGFRQSGADSDVDLMQRMRDGDDEAFIHLMQRHNKYVRWTLSQFTTHHHDIEDLQQEVFLRVYRACHSYQPQAKLTTWLFTIARNVALNSLRKKSRQCETVLPADQWRRGKLEKLSTVRERELPESVAARSELKSVVHYAISQLSQRQQTAIQLAYVEGLSHRAIAGSMKTTPEAVKSLLRRTRCGLRDALTGYDSQGTWPARKATPARIV